MNDTYNGGRTKALIDLRDTIAKYDYRYLVNWTKEEPKKAKLKSSFTQTGVPRILEFFLENYRVLMKWGAYIEFGIRPNTGELFLLTDPCDAMVSDEYRRGYKEAIEGVIAYMKEHKDERIYGKKLVIEIIENMMTEQMTLF